MSNQPTNPTGQPNPGPGDWTTIGKLQALSERQAQDHASIEELKQKFEGVRRLIRDDGTTLRFAALVNGFTEQEVREILALQRDQELTDDAFVTGLIQQLRDLRQDVNSLIRGHGEHDRKLRQLLDEDDDSSVVNRLRVTERHLVNLQEGRGPIFHSVSQELDRRFKSVTKLNNSKVPLAVFGMVTLAALVLLYFFINPFEGWWWELVLAVGIGALAAAIAATLTGPSIKTEVESSEDIESEEGDEEEGGAPNNGTTQTPTAGSAPDPSRTTHAHNAPTT